MEYIQDQKFYHIQILRPDLRQWNIGETIFIGDTKNPFLGYYDTCQFYESDNISDPDKIILLTNVLGEYIQFVRETVFEEVRQKHFPQLPSRQRCLWLIPDTQKFPEALNFWLNKLITQDQQYRILRLNCSGKLHYANQNFLSRHTGNFNLFREKAFKYWSGFDTDKDRADIECLFEGFVTVESILSSTIHT